MAIIYSYPVNNNILATDVIVGTTTTVVNSRPKNQTKSFEVGDLAVFINAYNTLDSVLNNGNTSLLAAKIGELGLYDQAEQDYGTLDLADSEFRFWDTSGVAAVLYRNGITFLGNGTSYGSISLPSYTTNHQYNLPDKTGVIALTSDIPSLTGYVPYTGATGQVDLGANNIKANEYYFLDPAYSVYGKMFLDAEEFTLMLNPTTTIARVTYGQLILQGISTYNATITYTTLTDNRVYALPNASGTIALTSDIAGFVPYTGATGPVNLGAYNLTVNSISIGKGAGTGVSNTVVGNLALSSNTTGNYNSAFGGSAIASNTTGSYNVGVGYTSLFANTTGTFNTAVGHQSLRTNISGTVNVSIGANSMFSNINGSYNTAVGVTALQANTAANYNSAFGHSALYSNINGGSNTGIGQGSLYTNASGSNNTAIGRNSLYSNTLGESNVAIGSNSLFSNTTASNNVAVGYQALNSNTVSTSNVAIGYLALNLSNSATAGGNTAVGNNALANQTAAYNNTAFGNYALSGNTTGTYNVGIGSFALAGVTTGTYNLGVGMSAATGLTTGTQNTHIGHYGNFASNSDVNSTQLGYNVIGSGSNSVTIGNASVTLTRLRGEVRGGSFVKDGGTAYQTLMADGSTSALYKYNFAGSASSTGTINTVNLLTITIPANSLTDILNIRSIMFQHSGPALAGVQVKVWTNSVNDFNTATQLANYSFSAGANLYAQISRIFSLQSGTLIGFPQTPSNATGTAASSTAMLSTGFNTSVINYLFVSFQLNNATDTVTLRNVNITN